MALGGVCLHYEGNKKDCPVSQNGRIYRLLNPNALLIKVYTVDPCLIPNITQQKCDYLYVINIPFANAQGQKNSAYFIELKGRNLTDAIKQLINSIQILHKSLPQKCIIHARIVGKRVTPDIKSRRVHLDELVKKFGGTLIIKSDLEYKETLPL